MIAFLIGLFVLVCIGTVFLWRAAYAQGRADEARKQLEMFEEFMRERKENA